MEAPLIRSPNYENNINLYGDDTNTCICCGKRIQKDHEKYSVHLTTNGTVTDEEEHPDSQGYFPIGNYCRNKLLK
jgi:DNA-directed RNA polymerase subunit N (RpoN/RPB10)